VTIRRGLIATALLLAPQLALAADKGSFADSPVGLMLVLAALSLLPFVLVMCTSFLKIAVVLSIVRNALGTPQVPPTMVITGLAIVLTAFTMAPTGSAVLKEVRPLLGAERGAGLTSAASVDAMIAAAERAREPVRAFLLKHAHERDRASLLQMARRMRPAAERAGISDRDFMIVAPAFVLSELSQAFLIGFLLFVPFLVVDMLVANLLLALGMQMLSPNTVSLPFKLLLFVLVDGWRLLARGLIAGYQ
jgi:type III secretion protein R